VVYLLSDALGAELRGELAAEWGLDGDGRDDRRDLAGVAVGRDEAGQRRDADDVQALVALDPDLEADEQRLGDDHAERAGERDEQPGAQRDLADLPADLGPVPGQ